MYANTHIPAFLKLCETNFASVSSSVQVVRHGEKLTKEAIQKGYFNISEPILVEDSPESIGMTVFRPSSVQDETEKKVAVRDIADAVGRYFPVRVMDVEHQEELQGWTLGDLVDYFESDERLSNKAAEKRPVLGCGDDGGRKKRKAALKAKSWLANVKNMPRILNQISLEYSKTPLGSKVLPPKFVRDLDWITNCWPTGQGDKILRPSVLYYCLTSAAGCYTDFHADFGGSSVYYHVLTGSKLFVLIRPTMHNLKVYEEWLGCKEQQSTFLADLISDAKDVISVELRESQTLFIPSGWIHAVYTPTDAIVLGGNFLHSFDTHLQLEIDEIEQRTRVPQRFRFPHFEMLHFYAAGKLLQKLRNNCRNLSHREERCLPRLLLALEKWYTESTKATSSTKEAKKGQEIIRAALSAAKANGCETINDFLQELEKKYEKAEQGKPSKAASTDPCFPTTKLSLVAADDDGRSSSSQESPRSPNFRINIKHNIDTGLKRATQSCEKRAKQEGKDQNLRIAISSEAKELHRPMPRTKGTGKRREELDFVDCRQDDEDWFPALNNRSNRGGGTVGIEGPGKRKRRANSGIATTVRSQIHKKGEQSNATKKPKTTARQRLLKKFR